MVLPPPRKVPSLPLRLEGSVPVGTVLAEESDGSFHLRRLQPVRWHCWSAERSTLSTAREQLPAPAGERERKKLMSFSSIQTIVLASFYKVCL